MPYDTLQQLPAQVKDNLPHHTQEICRAAFNSAWDEYHHDESRAHAVAWPAVENKYHKDKNGDWTANNN